MVAPSIKLAPGLQLSQGDIVKVRYELTLEEQANWLAIRAELKQGLVDLGVEVYLVQPILPEKSHSVRLKRVQAKSDERVVQDFGRAAKVPEATLKVGLELVREA
jgi:hypothetical protein